MAVTTSIYNIFLTDQWSGLVNLGDGGDTLKIALYDNSGTFSATETTYSTTNELATANGYTQGGVTLTSQAISGTTSKKFTATAPAWTTTGAGFTAYHAKIYDSTNSDHLIAHINFGAAFTASGGGTFTITLDADNGVFYIS